MARLVSVVLFLCMAAAMLADERVRTGPQVRATVGKAWPRPQHQADYDGFVVLRASVFDFEIIGESCDMLQDALKRYYKVITHHSAVASKTSLGGGLKSKAAWKKDPGFSGYLDSLQVMLVAPCEDMPYLHMDEQYGLRVNSPGVEQRALLTSQSVWGILRGLETFSQLLYPAEGGAALAINSTSISDFPRFPHRGLLLDTARHFLPKSYILETLDAMEANKLNVFHWHIVDDQSFPYQSKAFPELSIHGAYHPMTHIYTRDDVLHVVEHARQRGIRVLVEFDTPGHTLSWGEGKADLLTVCYSEDQNPQGFGPVDPTRSTTYEFMKEFFDEVRQLFPDKFLHLGGDEVSFNCWKSNPDINDFMKQHNISDYAGLEEMYIQKLVDIVTAMDAGTVVWQEVFDNGVRLGKDAVVQVWTGDQEDELQKVTAKGNPALLSTCWYLDHLLSGGDWRKFYLCDPTRFNGTEEQKALVLGGEACMWGEVVDSSNLHSRVWPRASAAAEKLWSAVDVIDLDDAARRLEEHTCRMRRRGIPAQPPNGPGFCLL